MEWISVKDRLPEAEKPVLLWFSESRDMAVGFTACEGEEEWRCCVGEGWYTDFIKAPDYWKPLPAGPQNGSRTNA